MIKLSLLDLGILRLGINEKGKFDENDIAKSELNKLGVGRILDQLASLKERNLIAMNKEGSFSITEDVKKVLWDENTPIEIRILRILEISPQTLQKIASLLLIQEDQIHQAIEELQKNHLVLMSTVKKEERIVKMYEILSEGVEYLSRVNLGITQSISELNPQLKNLDILQDTIEEISKLKNISEEGKNKIIKNLESVKKNLDSGLL